MGMGRTKYQGRYKSKFTDINITEVQKLDVSRSHVEGISQHINQMIES